VQFQQWRNVPENNKILPFLPVESRQFSQQVRVVAKIRKMDYIVVVKNKMSIYCIFLLQSVFYRVKDINNSFFLIFKNSVFGFAFS